MTIKIRAESELNRVKQAWSMSDEGALMWISGVKKGSPVCVQVRQLATEMLHGEFSNTKSYGIRA
jgi:hypothetical protein